MNYFFSCSVFNNMVDFFFLLINNPCHYNTIFILGVTTWEITLKSFFFKFTKP